MSTIREQIVAAVVTAINTDRPSGIPAAVRTRIASPTAEQLPALTVYQEREIVSPMYGEKEGTVSRGPLVRRTIDINVEAIAAAEAGEVAPDTALDPILAWVTNALAVAGRFNSLSAELAEEIGTKFSYERSDFYYCRGTMGFRIKFITRTDDAERIK